MVKSTNFKFKVVCTHPFQAGLEPQDVPFSNPKYKFMYYVYKYFFADKLYNFYWKLFICRKLFSRFGLTKGFSFQPDHQPLWLLKLRT